MAGNDHPQTGESEGKAAWFSYHPTTAAAPVWEIKLNLPVLIQIKSWKSGEKNNASNMPEAAIDESRHRHISNRVGVGRGSKSTVEKLRLLSLRHLLPCTLSPHPQFRSMTKWVFFTFYTWGWRCLKLLVLSQESVPRSLSLKWIQCIIVQVLIHDIRENYKHLYANDKR